MRSSLVTVIWTSILLPVHYMAVTHAVVEVYHDGSMVTPMWFSASQYDKNWEKLGSR